MKLSKNRLENLAEFVGVRGLRRHLVRRSRVHRSRFNAVPKASRVATELRFYKARGLAGTGAVLGADGLNLNARRSGSIAS